MAGVCLAAGSDASQKQSEAAKRTEAALAKQRASAARQLRNPEGGPAFFSTPWVLAKQPLPVGPGAPVSECDPLDEGQLQALITAAASSENVPPKLIRAVLRKESGGRPCAVSSKGAEGLMQIMPGTQADLGLTDPFDPAENVRAGARYLKQMLDRYNGDTRLALAAYNAGPERVDAKRAVPDIAETQDYVSAITAEVDK